MRRSAVRPNIFHFPCYTFAATPDVVDGGQKESAGVTPESWDGLAATADVVGEERRISAPGSTGRIYLALRKNFPGIPHRVSDRALIKIIGGR